MVRIAKKPNPERIAELKKKINNASYLQAAIHRIAHQLTKELIDMEGKQQ